MAAGVLKWLARPADYRLTWQAMQAFTCARHGAMPDEIWLCEHAPVYTQGQAGKPEHVLIRNGIDLVQTDRGGQVTYHGPGQLVAYALVDLRRAGLFVRDYVRLLEDAVLATLDDVGVAGGCRVPGAPGVYVTDGQGEPAKIAALGVKIRQGCSYHGVALNVDMDLSAYDAINPCGFAGMRVTDLRRCGATTLALTDVGQVLGHHLLDRLEAATLKLTAHA